jgi:hypothetical protein
MQRGAAELRGAREMTAMIKTESAAEGRNAVERSYRLSLLRTLAHKAIEYLPPAWRELFAETSLRRRGAPGPALEHVVQYRLSVAKAARAEHNCLEAKVARAADNFYEKQYRQFLNAKMGAFASTATQVLIASGTKSKGWLWSRHRRTVAAIIEATSATTPIVVIDEQTVAVAVLMPALRRGDEQGATKRWLMGKRSLPAYYETLIHGREVPSLESNIRTRVRSVDGSILEVLNAVIGSQRLALLALHPHDPDAMGLHITLFDVAALTATELERDYGLDPDLLTAHREAARTAGRQLFFLVGATEEIFTQCSQNLFVKRPAMIRRLRPQPTANAFAWQPLKPLAQLLNTQFELLQVTVSASGLPGASPRNSDLGKAGYIGVEKQRSYLLIPYFPGNAVHGHAAKLFSNAYATVIVADDHHALTRVSLSGRCKVATHEDIKRRFPAVARKIANQMDHSGKRLTEPEYWFLQDVAEITQEAEPLSANVLDPARPTCSISAGGQARHNKKPAYFAAQTLPPYDRDLQHQREHAGRETDLTGARHRAWMSKARVPLMERQLALLGFTSDARPWHAIRGMEDTLTQGTLSVVADGRDQSDGQAQLRAPGNDSNNELFDYVSRA